jgi:hypothetical protein
MYRLIGKLYFFFVIVPFIGDVLKAMCDTTVRYYANKAADPEWTLQKQRQHDQERRARRRRHSGRY